jgi:hypothetical protein
MFRILGITDQQIIDNGDTAFNFSTKNWVRNQENASLIYDQINYNIATLENKLEYLSGFKNPNTTQLSNVSDNLISALKAKETLIQLRNKTYLEQTGKEQITKNIRTQRFDKYIKNNSKKDHHIYEITGPLYTDDQINFKNLKFRAVHKKESKYKLLKNKQYLIIENPIVGHRLSREQSLDGYAWHYLSNTVPTDFIENFSRIEQNSLSVSKNIKRIWITSLDKFRENKAHISDIFTHANLEKKLQLDRYFKSADDISKFNDDRLVKIGSEVDFDAKESAVYYLSKLLLTPDPLQRQYIANDQAGELAFLKLNDRVFKDTFQWLADNDYKDVARQLIKEYNANKSYLMGHTNENTISVQPSAFYMKKWQIDYNMANKPLLSLMQGVLTPDAETIIKSGYRVKDTVGDKLKEERGEYQIREVRNSFSRWKEKSIDNRIANCK